MFRIRKRVLIPLLASGKRYEMEQAGHGKT